MGIVDSDAQFNLVADEISEARWVSPAQLAADITKNPQIYCPWMLIALYLLPKSDGQVYQRYKTILDEWTLPQLRSSLLEAIRHHLPDDRWRFVN